MDVASDHNAFPGRVVFLQKLSAKGITEGASAMPRLRTFMKADL